MKTILLSFAIMLATISMYATTATPDEYVKTKDNAVVYYSKLTLGPSKATLVLDNGETMTLMNNELVAYKKDGKIFEKVQLYVNNRPTKKDVFMEIIKYKNGMKLYKYCTFQQDCNLPFSVSPTKEVEKYYVFKNGNYHLQIDEANYKNVFAFFGIKVSLVN